MKNKLKGMSFLMVVFVLFAALLPIYQPFAQAASAGEQQEYFNKTGFPIVNEPITLRILATRIDSQLEFEKLLVWQEYEKMTGVKIDWIEVSKATLTEKRNLMLAGGDLPDVFFRANMPIDSLINYGSQGVFVGLDDLINDYAPNIKEAFEKYPDVAKGLRMPDGNIYSLPYIDDNPSTKVTAKVYMNNTWLENLGLELPETTDEMYDVLKAFRENDPNGNGLKDEVPYSSPYQTLGLQVMYAGSFGLMNRGNVSRDFDIDEKTGDLRYIPIQPEFKAMLEWFHKLYSEELLDSDVFTMTPAQFLAKVDSGVMGAGHGASEGIFGTKYLEDYVGLPTVLKGPEGHQILNVAGSSIRNFGSFVMTKANKYPEATIRWVDYFYSEEGIRFYFMGIEGETYYVEDEKYVYVDEIMKNPNGIVPESAVGLYFSWNGGDNPTIVTEKYFVLGSTPITMEVVNGVKDFAPSEVWPSFVYTPEENDQLVALQNDINTYVNEMRDKFISGKTSFDEWDKYVDMLNKMGVDEYKSIFQAAYDRYSGLK